MELVPDEEIEGTMRNGGNSSAAITRAKKVG